MGVDMACKSICDRRSYKCPKSWSASSGSCTPDSYILLMHSAHVVPTFELDALDFRAKYCLWILSQTGHFGPFNPIRHAKKQSTTSTKTQHCCSFPFVSPHFKLRVMLRCIRLQIHTILIMRGDGGVTEFFALAEACTTTSDVVCLIIRATSPMP